MPVMPKNLADDCLTRARRILAQARKTNGVLRDDLARLAMVQGVAALDTYMHTLIIYRVSDLDGNIPRALEKLDIPFDELVELADNTRAAQRERRSSRPFVQLKNAIHRRLLTETFQSYRAVANAMAMAGISRPWRQVADEMGCLASEIEESLGRIVHRRNQIVHEGDFPALTRPQTIRHNDVVLDEVSSDLDWLRDLMDAIDRVDQLN